jgi:glycosyltransferase involved in cell wall biosynthesis
MHVAFNAVALLSPLTGIGQYAFEIANRLAADPEHEAQFFYALLGWSPQVRAAAVPAAGAVLPRARRYLPQAYRISRWLQGRSFARGLQQHRFDLYHDPNYLPFPFDGPVVTTVHDLSWIRFPQAHPPERVRAMNRYFEPALRRSTLVLTDSEFVKREIVEVFGIDPARIVPIPLGVSAAFGPRAPSETEPVLRAHGLRHGGYLLAVATLEPRKNLVAALRAYAALPDSLQNSVPLVLAGLKGWGTGPLEQVMAPLVASGRVRLTGYLSRPELALLTAGAAALVYPSIYEGFGLPPLEAMACGVPTIVSNVASLPEVVGDTGLLIDPHDDLGIRDAMRELIDEPQRRAELAARALARSTQFSWEKCYAATVAAYRRAVAAQR